MARLFGLRPDYNFMGAIAYWFLLKAWELSVWAECLWLRLKETAWL